MESKFDSQVLDHSEDHDNSHGQMSVHDLENEMQRLAGELDHLNGQTADEFISIGSSLNEFYSSVAEISNTASSSADLIMGKEIARAIGDFQSLQDRVKGYLNRIKTEMDQCMKSLREIFKMVKNITKPAKDLKEIAQMLQMLAVSTRIVTVRLSRRDSSFNALADNIKSMSRLINSKSSDIMAQSKALGKMIEKAILTINILEDRQSVLAGEILNNTSLGLDAIQNMNSSSSDAAGITHIISDKSTDISVNLSEIMVSLQFHDITHQKIENYSKTMKTCSDPIVISKQIETDAINEESIKAYDIYLKSKQLKEDINSANNELVKAIDAIVSNLRGIGNSVANLSSEIGANAGAVSDDYSSFWLEMDQVMSSFTTSIREDADTSGKLSEVMSSVSGTVSDISLYVSDIEEIGSDIRLIAFNARIKAAHVGEEGAAVGLLAERIQKLSVDAALKTGIILDTWKKISTYAKELATFEQSGTSIEDVGLDDVVNRLIDILNPLHMVDDKIISYLNRMDNDSNKLVMDIESLIAGITVHDRASEVLGQVVTDINQVEMSSYGLCPDSEAQKRIDALRNEEVGAKEEGEKDNGDFDDNIELF